MKGKVTKLCTLTLLFGLFSLINISLAYAQEYPTKPIKILVGYAPGGSVDTATRIIASKAEKFLGQPFVISNNSGGGGSIALEVLAKEKPDGYTLVSAVTTGLTLLPQTRAVAYKLEDFVPIMHFGAMTLGLFVKADSPWKTLKEFVEYAKKNPRKVTYSTSGVGLVSHLALVYVAKQEGIEWTLVPYPGTGPAITALLGGHITASSADTTAVPHVKEGTLRILATYGEKRMKNFPDVPILRELGYDFIGDNMFILAAPKGTSPSIVKKLDEVFHKAMEDPEFIQSMDNMEFAVTYRNSADTKKYLEEAYKSFGKLASEIKILKEPERK